MSETKQFDRLKCKCAPAARELLPRGPARMPDSLRGVGGICKRAKTPQEQSHCLVWGGMDLVGASAVAPAATRLAVDQASARQCCRTTPYLAGKVEAPPKGWRAG